ncbi:MAG: type VI secretion system-associated protein TagF [Nitrospira sp.]|nr:type VI secretion system-associated protein TagF [Nitrospira sp.]
MPVSPEFLRLYASGPELRWFDEWLQRGMLYAKAQEGAAWQERLAHAGPYSFFYVPRRGGRVVSGVLIASQDQAGRAFPFMSFVLFDRHGFADAPWLIPVATGQFLRDTTTAIRTLRTGLEWEAFSTEVQQRWAPTPRALPAKQVFTRFTQITTVGQWWWGAQALANETNQAAIARLFTQVEQARRYGAHTLRFAICSDGSASHLDLSFWLQLYFQNRSDELPSQTGLICFWKNEPHGGVALMSIGPEAPNAVRFLVNPEAEGEDWRDVTLGVSDILATHNKPNMYPLGPALQASLATMPDLMRERMAQAITQ